MGSTGVHLARHVGMTDAPDDIASWHRIDHIPIGTKCTVPTCTKDAAWVLTTRSHRIVLCHECHDRIKRTSSAWAERIEKDMCNIEGQEQ